MHKVNIYIQTQHSIHMMASLSPPQPVREILEVGRHPAQHARCAGESHAKTEAGSKIMVVKMPSTVLARQCGDVCASFET